MFEEMVELMDDVDDAVRSEAIDKLCSLITYFDSELVAQKALPKMELMIAESDKKIHDRLVTHSG